jgi:hypothetical protein
MDNIALLSLANMAHNLFFRFDHVNVVNETTVPTRDSLPLGNGVVEDGELGETVVSIVKLGGKVGRFLSGVESSVRLNVAGHSVHNVEH